MLVLPFSPKHPAVPKYSLTARIAVVLFLFCFFNICCLGVRHFVEGFYPEREMRKEKQIQICTIYFQLKHLNHFGHCFMIFLFSLSIACFKLRISISSLLSNSSGSYVSLNSFRFAFSTRFLFCIFFKYLIHE